MEFDLCDSIEKNWFSGGVASGRRHDTFSFMMLLPFCTGMFTPSVSSPDNYQIPPPIRNLLFSY